ncbi:hypothetical protein TNCV_1744021 [Trichonephila clavipes]|nr:hypothetical protein TNCV_1744021 [Trichonephila clavipes]
MPTSAIKDLLKKWEAVRAMVLEWHPNQADVRSPERINRFHIEVYGESMIGLRTIRHVSSVPKRKRRHDRPYLPDMNLCDFYVSPKLKEPLRGRRFKDVSSVHHAVGRFVPDINIQHFAKFSNDFTTFGDRL